MTQPAVDGQGGLTIFGLAGDWPMAMAVPLAPMLVLLVLTMAGCTADGVKQGVYEGLVRQRCLEVPGRPGCASEPRPYDAYLRERAHFLKHHERTGCTDG